MTEIENTCPACGHDYRLSMYDIVSDRTLRKCASCGSLVVVFEIDCHYREAARERRKNRNA